MGWLNLFQAYQYIDELKRLTPVISYQLLQKTGIGISLNGWIRENKNSKEIRSVTIREAEKVLGRWKEAMQRWETEPKKKYYENVTF